MCRGLSAARFCTFTIIDVIPRLCYNTNDNMRINVHIISSGSGDVNAATSGGLIGKSILDFPHQSWAVVFLYSETPKEHSPGNRPRSRVEYKGSPENHNRPGKRRLHYPA